MTQKNKEKEQYIINKDNDANICNLFGIKPNYEIDNKGYAIVKNIFGLKMKCLMYGKFRCNFCPRNKFCKIAYNLLDAVSSMFRWCK